MIFVEEPDAADADKLEPIKENIAALWRQREGRLPDEFAPRAGILSSSKDPDLKLPAARCGTAASNLVILVGDIKSHLFTGTAIAHKIASQGASVVVVAAPKSAQDANDLAAAALSGQRPQQIVLLDPGETASWLVKRIFEDRIEERNRALRVDREAEVDFAVVGAEKLSKPGKGGEVSLSEMAEVVSGTLSQPPAASGPEASTAPRTPPTAPVAQRRGRRGPSAVS